MHSCTSFHLQLPKIQFSTACYLAYMLTAANNSWNCDFMFYLNFLPAAERMKKVSNKNPQRVGANFDRKKETGDDW